MVNRGEREIKSQLQDMEPDQFEELVAGVWRGEGYQATVSQQSRDKGIDIEASKKTLTGSRKVLIQTKCYSDGNTISSDDVRRYSTLYQQEDNVDQVIIVTSGEFASPAKDLAKDLEVTAINGNEIAQLVSDSDIDPVDNDHINSEQHIDRTRPSSAPYYTNESWQNWLNAIEEIDKDIGLDPEDEDSARLLLNMQDNVAIGVAKILTDFENGEIGEETAVRELEEIEEFVLAEHGLDSEEATMLMDGVQTALLCVFWTAKEYVVSGPAEEVAVPGYIEAATEAEAKGDMETALSYCIQAGTLIIDGEELDRELADELDFGRVAEWVNGLDSLQTALADPEVVED